MKSWYSLVVMYKPRKDVTKTVVALLVIVPLSAYFATTASAATANEDVNVIACFYDCNGNARQCLCSRKKAFQPFLLSKVPPCN